jgi:hypothetical protein
MSAVVEVRGVAYKMKQEKRVQQPFLTSLSQLDTQTSPRGIGKTTYIFKRDGAGADKAAVGLGPWLRLRAPGSK